MALIAPSYKAFRFGSPKLITSADATSAQNAIIITEWVTYLFDAASHGNVLNSTGVRSLSYQQLC